MIKNWSKITLVIILILNISGCAELQRKFVRKKEPKKEEITFYRVKEYAPKPPHERYKDHYVLWRNWHLELERTDGTGYSKDIMVLNEILRHLTAMRDLLKDEKSKELGMQIGYLETLLARVKEKEKDIMKDVHSRKILEKVGRVITNNFSYNRMKDYIKSGDSEKSVTIEESEEK